LNRFFAFLLATCTLASAGELQLRIVLDATNAGAYNRWVWLHKAECPDFPTVYITCDSMKHRGEFGWQRPAVSFWTDSGPLFVHRILPESQAVAPQMGEICDISPNFDQLTVASGGLDFVMYDRLGRRLFKDPYRPEGLVSGRWIRMSPDHFGMLLLDDSGKVLRRISPSTDVRILRTDDSVCALSADSTVVFIDRDGGVLWRSRKINAHCVVAAAPNGGPVAAATSDSLVICIPPGARTVVLPHDKDWSRFGRPTMAWSADGQLLAIYQGNQASWDSGRVFVVNKQGQIVRPARKLRLYNVRSLLWMGDTLVLPALNVDVSHVEPWYESGITADSCVVSFLPPDGGMVRSAVTRDSGCM
jgi:hypothetical protein